MVFGWVKEFWFVTYTDEAFEDFLIYCFQLKEMITNHSVRALKIFKIINLTSFHKEDSIKLRKQSVEILKQSLCDVIDILLVNFRYAEEVKP